MFDSLDDGRPSVTRKTLLRGYGIPFAISLLGLGIYTYKYSHLTHRESRIYADIAVYALALFVSAYRLLRVGKSEGMTQTESNFYVWCICVLLWLPTLIRGL
jgi:hypothetical protein